MKRRRRIVVVLTDIFFRRLRLAAGRRRTGHGRLFTTARLASLRRLRDTAYQLNCDVHIALIQSSGTPGECYFVQQRAAF